jgi:hypothetical protein
MCTIKKRFNFGRKEKKEKREKKTKTEAKETNNSYNCNQFFTYFECSAQKTGK